MLRLRDIAVLVICGLWLIASMVPLNMPDCEVSILGIQRNLGYFIYDMVHKTGILLALWFATTKQDSKAISVAMYALFGDAVFEVFDLIVTDDNGPFFGLLIQNMFIAAGFVYGLYKYNRMKK